MHSSRRWSYNIADHFLKGGFSDAVIYDSNGYEYKVEKIYFSRPKIFDRIIGLITPTGQDDMVRVDMELKETGQYSLEEFCSKMRKIALDHPDWWKRHSDREEIEQMFEGCTTFKAAINDIGVLDPPSKEKLKGTSDKVVDLRKV